MRIGIVDDDPEVLAFVSDTLTRAGHHCDGFDNGAALLAARRRETFDLLLLDWHLPDISGFDILKQVRSSDRSEAGIIMLTNQSDKDAIAEALRAGADDYIIKPESGPIIAARVDAVLRRARRPADSERLAQFGEYVFDRLTETVRIGENEIPLNNKEFGLALLLFENMHRPMSRGYILETIWHADPNLSTRTLDMHVSRIRTKLHLRPENGFRIAAISSYGYRMESFGAGNSA